jgi:hypothetical protein
VISGFAGEVLSRLLEGDHAVLTALREQSASAEVRSSESSDIGTLIDLWVSDDASRLEVDHRFAIDDLFGRVEGVDDEVGFQLHVVRGRLKTIEAWVSAPGWPDEPALAESWYVAHDPDPEVAELVRVGERDVEFAVRGIHGDPTDEDTRR